ncbi:type II secretion system protein GspL [Vibrio cholerae]
MNESLIVRLSHNPNAAVQWLVWSAGERAVIASGELANYSQRDALAQYAKGRATTVLLSAADVVLKQVEIPAGAGRQFESMLPYLLEDELAQDVDELHFVVLAKQGNQAHVCAAPRVWLASVLDDLCELGCSVRKVLPDVLALPKETPLCAAQIGEQWLMSKPEWQGVSVEASFLPWITASDWVRDSAGELMALTALTPLPESVIKAHPAWQDCVWENEEGKLVMQVLAEHALLSPVNLLTGAFKPKSSLGKYWRVWQGSAMAAMLLLALICVDSVLKTARFEAQADAYRNESERLFREALPGRTRIPTVSYLKREMEREAAQLSGGSSETVWLEWMVQLPDAVSKVPGLSLTSIKFDRNRKEVRLEAQSDDFQSFERAKAQLESRFKVEQGQLSRSGERVNGSFVLTLRDGQS